MIIRPFLYQKMDAFNVLPFTTNDIIKIGEYDLYVLSIHVRVNQVISDTLFLYLGEFNNVSHLIQVIFFSFTGVTVLKNMLLKKNQILRYEYGNTVDFRVNSLVINGYQIIEY